MKIPFVIFICLFFITPLYARNHAPVVSNVTVHQRAGAKYVDIAYNVSDADGDTLRIFVRVSNDSGKTHSIIPVAITGEIGSGIFPGTGKSIVWNAGADCPYRYGTKFQVKVIADDNKGGGQGITDGYGEYVFVPAGSFLMGDNFNTGSPVERPVHTVSLNAYYIGKYEVTNAEYKKFIDDEGYTTQSYWSAGGYGKCGILPYDWNDVSSAYHVHGGGTAGNENYPVVGVSWYEACAYCKWLSVRTGVTYRLPTEAEWEKAARGDDAKNSMLGHQRMYPWGDSIDGSYANYWNSGDYSDNGVTTVGFFNGSAQGGFVTHNNASPYGAYDMAGNVLEWCYDWYGWGYYKECYDKGAVTNPTGPSSGDSHIARGGRWLEVMGSLRSTYRFNFDPMARNYSMGFRWVREQ